MATKSFQLELELITPCLCHGFYQNFVEIRISSIIGSLRYWWRAIHKNLIINENYNELYKKESELFGSKNNKSSIIISLENKETKNYKVLLLPHRKKSKKVSSLLGSFTLNISYNDKLIQESQIKNLFKITGALGGIGKRTSRGFGRFQIKDDDFLFEQYSSYITNINPYWSNTNNNCNYPYLISVEKGVELIKDNTEEIKSVIQLLEKIGYASHIYCNQNSVLGYANGNNRLKSTINVGIIKVKDNYHIIISVLGLSKANLYSGNKKNFIDDLKLL